VCIDRSAYDDLSGCKAREPVLQKENQELKAQVDHLVAKQKQRKARRRTAPQRQQQQEPTQESDGEGSDSSFSAQAQQRAARPPARAAAAAGVAAAAAAAADSVQPAAAGSPPYAEVVRRGRRQSAPPAPLAPQDPSPQPNHRVPERLIALLQTFENRPTKQDLKPRVLSFYEESNVVQVAAVFTALRGEDVPLPDTRLQIINAITDHLYANWGALITTATGA
jgi:hypothetical protein